MGAMKNTGVAWIGEIPSEWELGKVKYGFDRKKEKSTEKDPVVLSLARAGVRVRDISTNEGQLAASYEGYNPVEPNDLLLNPMDLISGANCSISHVSGVISPAYMNLRARNGFDPRYYDYFFKTQYWSLALFAHGKGVSFDNRWTLNESMLRDYFMPMPPYQEQQTIADYLDDRCSKIDEIIAEATASIEEYKELKQAVIFEAVTKGLDKNVPMKDSGVEWIGSIPKAWNMTILRRFCSFQTGKTPSTSVPEWFDGDVNWFTPGDFSERYYLEDSRRKLSQKALDDSAAITVEKDCVMIVGIGGSAGKVGLTRVPCSCNQQITAVVSSVMDPKYLMYYLELDGKFLKETAMFTTLPILNNDTLGNSPLIVPTIKEQKNIADYLDHRLTAINTLIGEKQALTDDLQAYKKSLIYEVVTGKKRVVI